MRQGEALEHFGDVAEFGGGAAEEFAAGGCVEEEVADLDGGADVAGGGLGVGDASTAVVDLVGRVAGGGAGEAAGNSRRRHEPAAGGLRIRSGARSIRP